MTHKSITYSELGVNYDDMDPWKILCQSTARLTKNALSRHHLTEVPWSRGESAYIMEGPDCYYGHVEEGLGTKNIVADEMYKQTGKSYYDAIAQDLVAAIVNDLSTLGVSPVCLAPHVAAGDSSWFSDKKRAQDFVDGFKKAAEMAGAVWGPGESPALKDIVHAQAVELSGSCFGMARPKSRLIVPKIKDGDTIVLIESSGIHTNGLTLARHVAKNLKDGYLTPLTPGGTTYGAALLAPSHIYSKLVDALLDKNIPIHYCIHVTGHGWRKLMRHTAPFAYMIDRVPEVPALFNFMQEHGPIKEEEAYANFNMGAGFAFIVPPTSADQVVQIAKDNDFKAWASGEVKSSLDSRVDILPKKISFSAKSLALR